MESPANTAATVADAMNKLKSGQISEAVAALRQASAANPDDPQIYTCLGVAYTNQGDTNAAVSAFEQALAIQKSPRAYYNVGLAYESVFRTEEARESYTQAVAMDPNYTAAIQAVERLAPPVPAEPVPVIEPVAVTQGVVSGPEPTIMGEAPVMPSASAHPIIGDAPDLTSVFATPSAPPDLAKENMEREIRFAEQRHDYIKSALIYGTICGAMLLPALAFIGGFFSVSILSTMARIGVLKFTLGWFFGGAIYGAIIGYWIGHTCGGEDAGRNAGAVMGAVVGLFSGLITGMGVLSLFSMLLVALSGAYSGMQIGRMVESSIGWN